MNSIVRNVLVSNLVVACLVFLATGLFSFYMIQDGFRDQFENSVRSSLSTLVSLPEFAEAIEPRLSEAEKKSGQHGLAKLMNLENHSDALKWNYVQVWDENELELYRSPTIGDGIGFVNRVNNHLKESECFELQLPNGNSGIGVLIQFEASEKLFPLEDDEFDESGGYVATDNKTPQRLSVIFVRDSTAMNSEIRFVRNILLVAAVVGLVVSTLVGEFVTRRGVKPIASLANEIERLEDAGLDARISVYLPAELSPLANQLNHYLAKLEVAFERERGLSNDIAHELRTPLAALKMKLRYALLKQRSGEEYRELFSESVGISENLEGTVSKLLSLARIETGDVNLNVESVDLTELMQVTWDTISTASRRNFDLKWNVPKECWIGTDMNLFGQVLLNVFDNAVSYVDDCGLVQVRCEQNRGSVKIQIENTGCELVPSDSERVFHRLWRGDSSRTDTAHHNGLGLSIASRVMAILGGSILVTIEAQVFRVDMHLFQNDAD